MRKIRLGSLIGLLAVALMLSLSLMKSRPIEAFEEKLWDLRFKLRGPIKAPDNIVILLIDEKSIEKIGRWPWDREKIAQLINIISPSKPKLIALDIIFSEPSKGDEMLDQAFKNAGNVILPMAFIFDNVEHKLSILSPNDLNAKHSFPIVRTKQQKNYRLGQPFKPSGVLLPIQSFSSVTDLGLINTRPDDDGTLRFETLVIEYLGNYYPSFSLKIAHNALNLDRGSLIYNESSNIRIASKEIPIDYLGRTPIFYYGPEGTFTTYSIIDILEGKFPPNEFSNKIVLVGASALGLTDIKVTPTSVSMPGIEKNAHVIASFMEGKILKKAPHVLDISLLLLIGLFLTLILPRVKAIAGTMISLITLIAFAIAGYFLFRNNGVMMNMAYPFTEIFLIYIGITAYNFASEEKRAKKTRAMFSSYVTKRVVDELIKNPDMAKLGGERKAVTILFSDIRGFTSFSESRPPEEVVAQLNEYLGAMTEVVFKHEGTLDKFIGDAVMAFWGAPLEQNNHAELAIRCALHMIDRLSDLQKKWEKEGKQPFNIGIGLNTGEVLVGNIGIEGKKIDYTVIGDHVNLASRVESLTKTYNADILLTENTYNTIKDITSFHTSDKVEKPAIGHSKFSEVDTVKVKGKEQSVLIYRLESHPHRA